MFLKCFKHEVQLIVVFPHEFYKIAGNNLNLPTNQTQQMNKSRDQHYHIQELLEKVKKLERDLQSEAVERETK